MKQTRARTSGALVLGAVLAVVLSACLSGGRTDIEDTKNSGGGAGDNSGYTVAMITHETPGDTFWDKIKSGAQQAAKNYGITLKYSNDPDPGKQATLIQNAIDSKVDGIATTLATPDALAGAVKDANAAKIPVVAFNSGIDQYKQVGALMYFGSDETLAGETAGQRIADGGGKHPLCVIQASGSVALEARCAGVKARLRHREHPGERCRRLRGGLLPAGQALPGQVDRLHRHPGCPDRPGRAQGHGLRGQQGEAHHLRPQRRRGAGHQGRQDRVLDRPAALRPGIPGGDRAVPEPEERQRHRGRWPVLTGPSFVDKSNIDVILPFAKKGTR